MFDSSGIGWSTRAAGDYSSMDTSSSSSSTLLSWRTRRFLFARLRVGIISTSSSLRLSACSFLVAAGICSESSANPIYFTAAAADDFFSSAIAASWLVRSVEKKAFLTSYLGTVCNFACWDVAPYNLAPPKLPALALGIVFRIWGWVAAPLFDVLPKASELTAELSEELADAAPPRFLVSIFWWKT